MIKSSPKGKPMKGAKLGAVIKSPIKRYGPVSDAPSSLVLVVLCGGLVILLTVTGLITFVMVTIDATKIPLKESENCKVQYCKKCDDHGHCVKCITGYKVVLGERCEDTCLIKHCDFCGTAVRCDSCKPGFLIDGIGGCIAAPTRPGGGHVTQQAPKKKTLKYVTTDAVNYVTMKGVPECVVGNGKDYKGTLSIHGRGKECGYWKDAKKRFTAPFLHATSLAEVKNYCRNPKGLRNRPWCHTKNLKSWKYCDLRFCQCERYKLELPRHCWEEGHLYSGNIDVNRRNDKCMKWSDHENNALKTLTENYCRAAKTAVPECQSKRGESMTHCNIPKCNCDKYHANSNAGVTVGVTVSP